MFVDSVDIYVASGNGGAGCVSFRREKFVLQGGPDGGNGGRGGSVYFIGDKNTSTLANFRGRKKYIAQDGRAGMPANCNGKKGKDITIKVPPGTQIIDIQSGEILYDILEDGQTIKLLEGGKGGLGNANFKSSINQRPTYAQKGISGKGLHIRLELKLIADIALVGFPNVGKSSLIATITNSKPKIADYEFTTLIPNLGVVDIGEFESFVIADIPGLIQGASDGKGLGLKFLQHIERTKILLYMLDISRNLYNEQDAQTQFEILKQELAKYSKLLSQRPYAIALSKSDTLLLDRFLSYEFKEHELFDSKVFISKALLDTDIHIDINNIESPLFICPISSATHMNLQALQIMLHKILKSISAM